MGRTLSERINHRDHLLPANRSNTRNDDIIATGTGTSMGQFPLGGAASGCVRRVAAISFFH